MLEQKIRHFTSRVDALLVLDGVRLVAVLLVRGAELGVGDRERRSVALEEQKEQDDHQQAVVRHESFRGEGETLAFEDGAGASEDVAVGRARGGL